MQASSHASGMQTPVMRSCNRVKVAAVQTGSKASWVQHCKLAPGIRRVRTAASSADEAISALEVLRRENELLRRTISAADSSIEELSSQLMTAGVDVPEAPYYNYGQEFGEEEDEDPALAVWMPSAPVSQGGRFVEPYGQMKPIPQHDGTECLKWDQTLWSHGDHFKYRWNVFKGIRHAIDENEGGMDAFTQGYRYYGLNRGECDGKTGLWYREWAPAAKAVALVGEFNDWEPKENHWAVRNAFGTWELFLPDKSDGSPEVWHRPTMHKGSYMPRMQRMDYNWTARAGAGIVACRCKVKSRVETCNGEWVERIPAWIKWATQEWNEIQFNGVYWDPPTVGAPGELPDGVTGKDHKYTFKYPRPVRPRTLRIYECHVGMSSMEPKVNSYLEFRKDVLPRVRKLGYNAIQIMAIQEHAYYGSFGYHVTNFFGVSSRCGTPEELKAMIDEAHRMGMYVLMDIVHSHASKNTNDGINMWDGSEAGYFHGGGRGYHWMWDSRCFDYGNWETLRFLLSNSRWWVDEYKFDGYRFDGVTSMMYHHHGLSMAFTGNYEEYFGMSTDVQAVVYLMLVNSMLHDMFPNVITIGEDVSGMPTFCRPVSEGGVGFDYRLQMAIADKWIDVMKLPDEGWGMGDLVHTMTNRRYAEACVGYAESHDQALVGDKTIAFWLMDKEMYDSMSLDSPPNAVVDRGIALHKMIRLVTMALGGESYLNFMGNEFGHPEWIDFPRDDTYDPSTGAFVPGNGGSLEKCRRRWDLADAEFLKYQWLNAFDRAMQHLDKAFGFVNAPHNWVSRKDEGDKVIVCEKGDLVLVFNFHPYKSYSDYRVGACLQGPYKIVLSSDEAVFGGYRNSTKDNDTEFFTQSGDYDRRPYSFMVYAPSRTVTVYAPSEYCDPTADQLPTGVPGLGVKGLGPYFEP